MTSAVTDQLGKLAAFEPCSYPVVSLYLNTQPGPTGRDQFHSFVRKEFAAHTKPYPPKSPARKSLDRDLDRITHYLDTDLPAAANGVAVFACSEGSLFETVLLTAPIEQHWLYIGDRPHLYPLARIESLYPRYAAVVADTNSARILVIDTGEIVDDREVRGVKTRHTAQGGSSQPRYQRHIENFHLHHAKEVVDTLEEIVQRQQIQDILIAGDEVITPLLREQMPKHLAERVVDRLNIDKATSIDDVLRKSQDAMRRVREQAERGKVDAAVDQYRSGGLGVVGPEDTLRALDNGQVDELLVAASLRGLHGLKGGDGAGREPGTDGRPLEAKVARAAAGEAGQVPGEAVLLADQLVAKATRTSARITFIQDPALLAAYGGVAALLRYRN
jgi:peptide subunit release factor 1 (eRF1)